MKNNDLSNEVPARVIVTSDIVATEVSIEERRRFRVLRKQKSVKLEWDHEILSWLFTWSFKTNVVLELALIGEDFDDDDAAEYQQKLDKWGTNPFTWIEAYESAEMLARQLPYRNDIYGVVSGEPARYGRYGLGTSDLP